MKKIIKIIAIVFGIIFISKIISSSSEANRYSNQIERYSKTDLNVRNDPNSNSKILKTLKPNDKVIIYDTIINGYTMVLKIDSTKYGWTSQRYLQEKPLSKRQIGALKVKKNKQSKKKKQTKKNNAEYSLGYKLAVIDTGEYYKESDSKVKRFNNLLSQLSDKYFENEKKISDTTVKAKQVLEEKGIEESIINIMEGMNLIFGLEQENLKYTEYASSYVVMRSKGRTHNEAIENLTALHQSLGI
jgi:hypothetical protein